MTKVSIIIPHYNGYEILNDCLKSLYNSKLDNTEIIIVNNNSSDNSIEKVKQNFQELIILNLDKNKGYAGGCNYGSKYAKGDYLVFLNNDTEVDPEWLNQLTETLNNNPNIASVQPKIINKNNNTKFDYAGASGGFIDKYCYPFARGRIFYTQEDDTGQYDNIQKIFWASGTAFITKKLIFKKLGGFDQVLFAHMEEIDYHWKCYLNGYSVYVNPKSLVYHLGGATLSYNSAYKTYLNHRNSMLLLLSNYNLYNTVKIFIVRILLQKISILKDLATLNIKHGFAQIRALIWILLHPNVIFKRRMKIKNIRKISDSKLLNTVIYNKSIIYQYFIRRITKYSDLDF